MRLGNTTAGMAQAGQAAGLHYLSSPTTLFCIFFGSNPPYLSTATKLPIFLTIKVGLDALVEVQSVREHA